MEGLFEVNADLIGLVQPNLRCSCWARSRANGDFSWCLPQYSQHAPGRSRTNFRLAVSITRPRWLTPYGLWPAGSQ